MDDSELLQCYVRERSETAFAELVRRRVDLVYSAALRQVAGDPHRAQEVTQMVFIGLARQSAALSRHPALLAWLFRSVQFSAAKLHRGEARRRIREAAAAEEAAREAAGAGPTDWAAVRPVIDNALNGLRESDREAILTRFLAGRTYEEIGRQLGVGESAARMRVERALEKLRGRLARRGIRSTAAALAAVLSECAVAAAPPGTAAAATAAALGAGAGTGALAAAATLMSATKIHVAVVAAALAAGAAGVAIQHRTNSRLRDEIRDIRDRDGIAAPAQGSLEVAAVRRENARLERAEARASAMRQAASGLDRLRREAETLEANEAAGRAAMAKPALSPGVLPMAAVDVPARPISQPIPKYPEEMKLAGNSGQVVVQFVVTRDGAVGALQVVDSSDPAFESAALEAVSQWKFSPAQKGGVPVGEQIEVPINFSLSGSGGSLQELLQPGSGAGSRSWF